MDWKDMIDIGIGLSVGASILGVEPEVDTGKHLDNRGEWVCEYKDSGLVKSVGLGDIARLCVSGTERNLKRVDGPLGPDGDDLERHVIVNPDGNYVCEYKEGGGVKPVFFVDIEKLCVSGTEVLREDEVQVRAADVKKVDILE